MTLVGHRKNTYKNCKLARKPRRNQKAYEAWAPQEESESLELESGIQLKESCLRSAFGNPSSTEKESGIQ